MILRKKWPKCTQRSEYNLNKIKNNFLSEAVFISVISYPR